MQKARVFALIVMVAVYLSVGCSGGGSSDSSKKVTGVTVTEGVGVLVGETVQLTAAVSPNKASNKSVSWGSDDT